MTTPTTTPCIFLLSKPNVLPMGLSQPSCLTAVSLRIKALVESLAMLAEKLRPATSSIGCPDAIGGASGGFHDAEEVGEVVFNACEVHFVEADKIGAVGFGLCLVHGMEQCTGAEDTCEQVFKT